MKNFYDVNGQLLFSANVKDDESILEALKKNGVIKSTSDLVIESDHEGRLFITDGIQDVATVE